MSILEILFMALWMAVGLHAWIIGFQPNVVWWLTAGIVDKILIAFLCLFAFVISLILGPVSYVVWRCARPRDR